MQTTDFPLYPKAECSYAIFYESKWHKAGKQLLLVYLENVLGVPRSPQNNLPSVLLIPLDTTS